MLDPKNATIERIIVHRVHKKDNESKHGVAEYSEEVFDFGTLELETLTDRIALAFSKQRRFFKLELARSNEDSFYSNSMNMKNCSDNNFIQISKSIADLLAESHDRKTIPSGLLLIMEGYSDSRHFVLVIKAEIQEAFTIKEVGDKKLIELVDDLFLSPAKEFYKIGYVIENFQNQGETPNDLVSCYMYDDNFSSGKRDLAEYFYGNFLGFTTHRNDKLLAKNYLNDFRAFIEKNVSKHEDKKGLKNSLNSLYRENNLGVINPQEFAEQNLPTNLHRLYSEQFSKKYPFSFNKDLSLVDRRLQRGQIKLVKELKIEGPADSIENVDVIDGRDLDIEKLKIQIDNGDLEQIITVTAKNNE